MLGSSAAQPLIKQAATRAFSSSAALRMSAPAIAKDPTAGGIFGTIFGGARVETPMTEPLPGVSPPPPVAVDSTPPATNVTQLSNGVKIASENTPGSNVTVGLYVDSGSVYEGPFNSGVSHLLEHMAFKTTANRTHFRLIREVEAIGANMLASASREQMGYTADGIKTHLPELVELLADSVLNPVFQPHEVKEQLDKMAGEIKDMKANPNSLLMEGLHSVAYQGALSAPLICPEASLKTLTSDDLLEFVAGNYTAPRMVLAASGVSQEELMAAAEPVLSLAPAGAAAASPASAYVGGDFRISDMSSPVTHVMLGFEFEGGWRDVKGSITMTVLQMLMGGGSSFSSGGPGKGMYSRLYTRVLNQYPWMQSCSAFNSLYNDTGLVGIHAVADSAKASECVGVVVKELQAVAASGGVSPAELERAKKATISSVLMNLESNVVVAEDIGRQILTYGSRKTVAEFVAALDSLTPADVQAAAAKLLKSKLSMASHGNTANVPRYDAVASQF